MRDSDFIRDCLTSGGVDGGEMNIGQVQWFVNQLPHEILELARRWGFADTEVRDQIVTYVTDNRDRIVLELK